jgi:hypothetical protein
MVVQTEVHGDWHLEAKIIMPLAHGEELPDG